ncbi:hypothetical protein SCHPADRAFT_634326 [Schizopora paradoxa]|uniref:Nephrocystin 3-like N-terminal domain-containing protein n=1 Tax=Schizopora paradoxa TaxID=27342 RepID=A0A0H2R7E8_9AGAM|nr:hypothetical protein SCHPADRAFT_634326 [Schizopora paradoxa]
MKNTLSNVGIGAVRLLEALSASADFNPVLKSVAGGALHFAKLVEDYHSDKKAWVQLAEHVRKNVALIAQSIASQPVDPLRLGKDLDELNRELIRMCSSIAQKRHQGTMKRVVAFIKDPKKIEDMQKGFDRTIQLFHLGADISIGQDVAKILEDIEKNTATLETVAHGVQRSMHIATLTRFPYAQGATWNPDHMCHPNTRVPILDEIMQWLEDFQGNRGKRIFCLTGAPGAGKSAIAHSISKMCADKGWLATAFFFSREDVTRAPMLFSTIVCDLAARFASFQNSVCQAIEDDPSLSAASSGRIFNGLIAPFSDRFPQDKPIVIVLDALDEGFTSEILGVLGKEFGSLPGAFQLFITSREIEGIYPLLNSDLVHHRIFNHHSALELQDTLAVAQTRLEDVAVVKGLKDWPTEEVVKSVMEKSQGLMIWIVTVCQYLQQVPFPKKDLQALLERKVHDDQGAEDKMNELYAMILLGFPWRNKGLIKGFEKVMGMIIGSKVPLTVDAMISLDSTMGPSDDVQSILKMLKPLLLPSGDGRPIQVLHQSLHDLLADRAHAKQEWKLFSVDEEVQNQRLALLCLQVINNELSENIPGTGYTYGKETGVPKVADHLIPEHLKYACRFWVDHLISDKKPSEETTQALQEFFSNKFTLWLELTACIGPIINLNPLITWINDTVPNLKHNLFTWKVVNAWRLITYNLVHENRRNEALTAAELSCMLVSDYSDKDDVLKENHAAALMALSWAQSQMGKRVEALQNAGESHTIFGELAEKDPEKFNPSLAGVLDSLANRLSYMGLREDALQASRHAVGMYKVLVENNPASFNPNLARALDHLANMLSDMELREEALQTSRDAVGMYKVLAEKNPTSFKPNLATAFRNLANRLSSMGLREEALHASRDAVGMCKELAEKNPASFNPDLAKALENLGLTLSDMGLREEALQASGDAVGMYKELAEKNAASFNPDLARALDNLANRLSSMGLREEALQACRDAVSMYKVLAEKNPAPFNPDLAIALDNLAIRFSDMRLKEEALQTSRDAVGMYKVLAEKDTEKFNPDLAMALQNLAVMLSSMGLREEALQTSRDAVGMFEVLAEKNPASFNPNLARALQNLAVMLSSMGLREEALQSSRDAVSMYKVLAEKNPASFNPDLARSLDNLGTKLSNMGLREEALQTCRDALGMYKELAEKNPASFNPDLARVLYNIANTLAENNLMDESLETSRKTIQMCRELAGSNQNALLQYLAGSLYNYSISLSEIGMKVDALEAAKEAFAIQDVLVIKYPNNLIFQEDLAKTQKHLSYLEGK